jgi:hypothetical protein
MVKKNKVQGAAARLWPVLVLPAALAFSQSAHAEWGSTRWNMTIDDVVAAVGGSARKVADDKDKRVHDQQRLVTSTIVQDGITYEVEYYFGKRGRGLTMVRLSPTAKTDCSTMRAAYTEKLGPGVDQSSKELPLGLNIELIHWPTGPGAEVVELTEVRINGVQRACHVLYQQRDYVKS